MVAKRNQSDKKVPQPPEQENPEQFIKKMMQQRKLQQEALTKIMSSIDGSEERVTPSEPETEEGKLLQRIFRNKK